MESPGLYCYSLLFRQRLLGQRMQEYERLCQRERQLTKGKLVPQDTVSLSSSRGALVNSRGGSLDSALHLDSADSLRSKSLEDVLNSNDISLIIGLGSASHSAASENCSVTSARVHLKGATGDLQSNCSPLKCISTLPRIKSQAKSNSFKQQPIQSLPTSSSHSFDCLQDERSERALTNSQKAKSNGTGGTSLNNSKSVQSLTTPREASAIVFQQGKIFPYKSEPNTSDDKDFVTRL